MGDGRIDERQHLGGAQHFNAGKTDKAILLAAAKEKVMRVR